MYPSEPRPLASNLNLVANHDVANLAIVEVDPDGNIRLYNNAGSVHVVADVVAYYSSS